MPSDTQSVRERIEEAARQIGVLLIAFAPLDAAVNAAQGQKLGSLLYFVALGVGLFTVGIWMELVRKAGKQE